MAIVITLTQPGQAPVDVTEYADLRTMSIGGKAANGERTTMSIRFYETIANLVSFSAHYILKVTETATTPDTTLASGRCTGWQLARGAGRRGDGDIFQTGNFEDANRELLGLAFAPSEGGADADGNWIRPEETDVARVLALASDFLNGDPRATTVISTATYVPNTNTVTMEAKTYPAGTQPMDVMNDCASAAGKMWWVDADYGLHFDTRGSTNYTAGLSISDRENEVNNTTVFEPWWVQGDAIDFRGENVASGMVAVYAQERAAFYEDAALEAQFDYWIANANVSEADTEAEALLKATAMTEARGRGERTYYVTLRLLDSQVDLVKYGQRVSIKARATDLPSVADYRRIGELKWEYEGYGSYLAHLYLDYPTRIVPLNPGAPPGPKPAPEPVPDEPGVTVWSWSFTTNTEDDQSSTYTAISTRETAYWAPATAAFDGGYGRNKNSESGGDPVPITAGTDYTFTMDCMWEFDPSSRNVDIRWKESAGGTTIQIDRWVTGAGHATATEYQKSITLTAPVGADRVDFQWSPFKGFYVDNLVISTSGTVTEDDPDALPDGGDSPYYARSDDPRFGNDDQHLTTHLLQRVTNNSGVTLSAGDVVVPDTTLDGPAVTRTTTASSTAGPIGVIHTGGADDAEVVVLWSGAIEFVNTNGTPADGDYLFTSTTAGAADRSATRATGAFGRIVRDDGAGETLHTLIWGVPDASSGSIDHGTLTGLTDDDHTQYILKSLIAAKGDLIGGSANDVPSILSVGTAGQYLTPDTSQLTGLKWADLPASGVGELLISDTPSTPLVFADILQNEAQDDFLYADPSGESGTTDHGSLGGLGDNDHANYIRTSTSGYVEIFGILRKTSGTWSILDDANHTPVGLSSVAADSAKLTVTYSSTFSETGSVAVTVDETWAATYRVGASVGLSTMELYLKDLNGGAVDPTAVSDSANANIWIRAIMKA